MPFRRDEFPLYINFKGVETMQDYIEDLLDDLYDDVDDETSEDYSDI